MAERRREIYFEVLADLDEADVAAALEGLLREAREQAPPAGVIRARALALAGTGQPTAPFAASPPTFTPLPPASAAFDRPTAPFPAPAASARRRRSWPAPLALTAAALALVAVILGLLAGIAASRPAETCVRAVSSVDRAGQPIEGAFRCLESESARGFLTVASFPYLVGIAAALLIGALVLVGLPPLLTRRPTRAVPA
jgi:hypothetical protein